jgi:hypothetical protein
MSSHLFLTAPNPQIMQATSQRAPRIVISCNSPSSETSPQSVNCGAKRPKTTIRSAGDAICASESAIDAPEIAVDGECALLRLSAASSTTTTTSTTGTELPTVELAADVQRVIRYGMQLHQSASLHHAAHCFDLVRRRAAAPAERAFAAVNSIALLSKKARPISPELLEAADRDLQLAFLDVDSLSGEFSELFFFFSNFDLQSDVSVDVCRIPSFSRCRSNGLCCSYTRRCICECGGCRSCRQLGRAVSRRARATRARRRARQTTLLATCRVAPTSAATSGRRSV